MDPDYLERLTALPWELQVVLAAGYCSYLLAYVGLRQNHRPTDTVFASLAFGLVAYLALYVTSEQNVLVRGGSAVVSALIMGVVWRAGLRPLLRSLTRHSGYSWSDDTSSAWDCLQENSAYRPSQLTVEMDDGRYLMCSDTARCADLPYGPFTLGTAGDILMYVDRSVSPSGADREVIGVLDPEWGDLVTYVPKERVRKISIRLRQLNHLAAAAVE